MSRLEKANRESALASLIVKHLSDTPTSATAISGIKIANVAYRDYGLEVMLENGDWLSVNITARKAK